MVMEIALVTEGLSVQVDKAPNPKNSSSSSLVCIDGLNAEEKISLLTECVCDK